jgi:hypothetical protein
MTEEQRLKLFQKLNNETEPILEVIAEEKVEEVSSPTSVKELLAKPTERVQRDEYNLTYDELIEEYNFFNKSGVMKPQTIDRLWNS